MKKEAGELADRWRITFPTASTYWCGGHHGSPTCAVEETWYDDAAQCGQGVFIEILQEVLAARGNHPADVRIRAAGPQEALSKIKRLLCNTTEISSALSPMKRPEKRLFFKFIEINK